ncbi:hypothetical protein BGZ83_002751 [Gryganskiella cystojenkinii]|nr:hypothetical protein BGZ83_002751 [Gryganskiella cystojenkinii]
MTASSSPAPLIPPFRFGTVEPEVYRGAYPKQRNLRYLKRLKLKTILSLIPDKPDEVFQEFCREQGITPIHLPVDKVKDNVPLTYNRAVEAVQVTAAAIIMIDPDNLPIYVHCLDGASVTGLVVCCLRKLQTWNISSAMGEFLRYLRGGVISSEESVFVEKFASEIEISKPIPPWLWEGQVTFKKHPTLKLNFTLPAGTNPQHQQHQQQQINTPVSVSGSMPYNGSGVNSGSSGGSSGGGVSPKLIHHYSHQNTLATPTIAALTRIKRSNAAGGLNPFSQQLPPPLPQPQQPQHPQGQHGTSVSTPLSSSTTFLQDTNSVDSSPLSTVTSPMSTITSGSISKRAATGQSPSGLGVRVNNTMIPNLSGSTISSKTTTTTAATTLQSQASSAVISVIPQGDQASGSQTAENETTSSGGESKSESRSEEQQQQPQPQQSQPQQQQQMAPPTSKNSPAVNNSSSGSGNANSSNVEPVDEYYEVSMTLKALALEGADF